ncbi:uncharacterized protein LOC128928114 isoform X2 [Callithrix jacchus]
MERRAGRGETRALSAPPHPRGEAPAPRRSPSPRARPRASLPRPRSSGRPRAPRRRLRLRPWTAARCCPAGLAFPPVTAPPPPPKFSGDLPGASCSSGSSPWPPPPPPARSPGPPRPPPSPAAAGPGERQQRGPGGWEPRAQPPAPERSGFRAAAAAGAPALPRPIAPASEQPRRVRPGHGALRMRRGAGAGLRARSGVVSAAPRAPARPPPARAPRRGHAVSHLAGDQGDPGGPVHLRHPPHPLRDSLVHLPRCGLRPRHLSAAGPPGRHAGGVRGGRALGTERSRGAPSLALETPAPGPAAGPAPPPGLDLQRRAGESGSPKALENAGGCGVMCLRA